MKNVTLSQIQSEVTQDHSTRIHLIKYLEKITNRKILVFFTSFTFPTGIFSGDADIIESVLRTMNLENGLTLLISSPGGDGLEAERIVNVCRTYSDGDFEVIVPGLAKSAATMVCLGANTIWMSRTSELGPIDPQIALRENGKQKVFSIYNILESYKSLFRRAVGTKGNLEPFIAQLEHYDEREIAGYSRLIELSHDIAVKFLKLSMMKKYSSKQIGEKMKIFLNPTKTKVHGRPIFIEESIKVGLKINEIDIHSEFWSFVHEYATRLNFLTRSKYLKIVESADNAFTQSVPKELFGAK